MDEYESRQRSSTKGLVLALGDSMPKSRLQSLLGDQEFDSVKAGELFIENLRVSAKLWIFFHIFEILLRNSISDRLILMFPEQPWWQSAEVLLSQERHTVHSAQRKISEKKGQFEIGDVIGELNFGFWVELLSSKYHKRLWAYGLGQAFPQYRGKRRDLHTAVERLRKLRNRIAHHEPILNRDLDYDLKLLVTLIGYIEPRVSVALVENYNTARC